MGYYWNSGAAGPGGGDLGLAALVRHSRYAPLDGAACRGLSGVWCSTDVQMGRRSFMARLASAFPR